MTHKKTLCFYYKSQPVDAVYGNIRSLLCVSNATQEHNCAKCITLPTQGYIWLPLPNRQLIIFIT